MNARKPIIIAGGGVINSKSSMELLKIANKTNIPVVNTFMGLSSFPKNHPLFLGMLGMYGQYAANKSVSNADLIIALGTRFDDRITGNLNQFCPQVEIIHIDIDPAEIGKNISVKIPIVGDLKNILQQLNNFLGEKKQDAWLTEINNIVKKDPSRKMENGNLLSSRFIIESLNNFFAGEAIIVTDVGQHQMWAAHYTQVNFPRHFISSVVLGQWDLVSAAIGAKIGCPEKGYLHYWGWGFQMNIGS